MTHNVQNITTDQVSSVYSGRANHCACGCAGIHRYNSKHIEQVNKNRKYPIKPDQVNDKQITRVLNAIKKHADKIDTNEDEIVSATVGNRMYIVYLKETIAGWSVI